jgi:hypothetical protein
MTDDGVRMTERIEGFRDLRVYPVAFELQQEVFEVSKAFPKEEMFSLTDQIRRSYYTPSGQQSSRNRVPIS